MGLTGLEIYKQLPKKNCGECGPPTCLAFAMNLANGKASLDACPYVTEAAKAMLESASAPPIAKVALGAGSTAYELGDETELFRHDKKFYHETAIAVQVSDKLSEGDLKARLEQIAGLKFVRVGLEYRIQAVAVVNESGDAAAFQKAAEAAAAVGLPLVLVSTDPAAHEKVLSSVALAKPLLYAATKDNWEKMAELAKTHNCPLAIKAEGLEALAALSDQVQAAGVKQIVLDPGSRDAQAVADFTQIRRLAIKKRFRSFGFPIITFTSETDPMEEVNQAVAYVAKYASLVVLNTAEKAHILPLLTFRQNLYTDPQVPIRVEEKIHEVGAVSENSPVYVTTNFSLTYYSVEGEVEGSRVPAYIISVDTDGLSVLTSYADGKFEADRITNVMKKLGIESKVKHRNLVIPGGVAVLSGKLEELSGWKVIVGPREASGITAFAKSHFAS